MKKIILAFLMFTGFAISAGAQVEINARIGHRHRYHQPRPVYVQPQPVYVEPRPVYRRHYRRPHHGLTIRAHTSVINPTYLQRSQAILYTTKQRFVA